MLNLILFHRLLIAAGIIFCLTFAAYQLGQYVHAGGTSQLVLAIVFALLGIALAWYLKRLARVLNLPSDRQRRV
jgi:membrane protein implicated in regulation of membrane protease activity